MKKKIIITTTILSVCISTCAISCIKGTYEIHMRSMVSTYAVPEKLNIRYTGSKSGAIFLEMAINGTFGSKNGGMYDHWCEKHGDMSYNRNVIIHKSFEVYPYQFLAADYTAIEIVSDANWDAEHPAGTSLNDIAMFYSASPIKYIQSGYSQEYDWSNADVPEYFNLYNGSYYYRGNIAEGKNPFHFVNKRVSDLVPEDMVLLGSGNDWGGGNICLRPKCGTPVGFVEFITLPTENKEHNITVTLTTDENKTFSASIKMVFE